MAAASSKIESAPPSPTDNARRKTREHFRQKPLVNKIKRRKLKDCFGQGNGSAPEEVSHTYIRSHQSQYHRDEVSDYSSVNYSRSEKNDESEGNYKEPTTAALIPPHEKSHFPPFELESGQRTMEDYPHDDPSLTCPKTLAHTPKITNPQKILPSHNLKDKSTGHEIVSFSKINSSPGQSHT